MNRKRILIALTLILTTLSISYSQTAPSSEDRDNARTMLSTIKSLEREGVVPDELTLPSAGDLAAKRDPVLAHALSLLGAEITPEKAGALFPVEWKK